VAHEHGSDGTAFGLPPLFATVVLTGVAGFVDAFGFVHLFDTFTANMSGNAVLLGIALGNADLDLAARHVTALVGFTLGVAVGVLVDRRDRTAAASRPEAVLLVELAVLAGLTVAVALLGGGDRPFDELPGLLLIGPTAFAMGIQTPVITRTDGVPTPTTYMSGSVTHLAEAFTEARVSPDPALRRAEDRRGLLLLTVLAGYVGGASAGAAIGGVWTHALVVPTALLAGLLLLRQVVSSRPR
jgi:uncharacterized membrane protein YoaK (UPF0700 family)